MNETILLIEDNESIIMGLEYLLTEEQYTFLVAERSTGSSCRQAGGSCAS